jgi:ribosomal protein S18 acetylase RimI-like enzyme
VLVADRRAADAHLAYALRHFARHSAGGVAAESGDALFVASATRFAGSFHAAALRTRPDADPRAFLDAAQTFGVAHDREMTVWAAPDTDADLVRLVEDHGLLRRPDVTGMTISTVPEPGQAPPGVEVVPIDRRDGEAGVEDFADVHRQHFAWAGFSVDAVGHFASARPLTAREVDAFVAYREGRPAAAAMTIVHEDVAGIYWVSTRPDERRRGLGDLVTRAAVRAGFGRGARLVVLQATDLGLPVYRRIGFTPFAQYRRYFRPDPEGPLQT